MEQFQPINNFTSIDAHSRMADDISAISDPQKVAEVERLLKFGRAGWYSLYSGQSESRPDHVYFTREKI